LPLFCPEDPTSPEEGEIMVDIEEIAKGAAEEAANISAQEAATPAIEKAREAPTELEKPSGNTSGLVTADVGKDKQALAGPLEPTIQQLEFGAPSSSGAGEPTFEDAIAGILVPFSRNATATDSPDDSDADLVFLETMAASFKDVQNRYSKCWERLSTQQQTMDLAEQRLKEKVEEICKWYDEKFQSIKRQEEKLAAINEKATTLDGKLVEREMQLNAKEKDLIA
jgi:hypothetical protein